MFCCSYELYPYSSSFRGFTPLEVVELLTNNSFKIILQTVAYLVWYIKFFFLRPLFNTIRRLSCWDV